VHSFTQRFRVLKPNSKAIAEALQNTLNLPEEPVRIESFDISHMQGTDTVASMVVWEKGRMKNPTTANLSFVEKNAPKFCELWINAGKTTISPACVKQFRALSPPARRKQIATKFDSHRRRHRPAPRRRASARLAPNHQPAARQHCKKEEILYVYGQENEPIILDRHSPVLHLIQQIRDETHRFAVTFHRQRRGKRQTTSALLEIPAWARNHAAAPARVWNVANVGAPD